MLVLTILFLYGGSALAVSKLPDKILYDVNQAETLFDQFMQTYDKQYTSKEEKQKKLNVFKENLQIINEKNAEQSLAVFGITQFIDLTAEEFRQFATCLNTTINDKKCKQYQYTDLPTAPDSFDWREKNVVTRVKSQGGCGSCWAFSAIGNVESVYAIKHKKQIELSEQQLVDCDQTNKGCDGGIMSRAIQYLEKAGAMLERDYQYVGKQQRCQYNGQHVKVKVSDCREYTESFESEDDLRNILANTAPLSIGLDASDIQHYTGGILTCKTTQPNHGVLLVGYGVEKDKPFWTFKNSWGPNHGEEGYFRLLRGVNSCGMLKHQIVSSVVE
ncbi:uncharacterized protein LOC113513681 [Galleria mellonella]|uniref:Uncharacterized protein LOC113513681 n=1 Tax=Galleria mellonella TaxID=7137 RepID=A0A6J1WH48_GALME|nr:uncharacterized protein LOC113513681 [Galleria mellonella]